MTLALEVISPIVVGSVVGLIVSILFAEYGSKSRAMDVTVFGMNSNSILTGFTVFVIVTSLAILTGLSAIIRDTEYMVKEPFKFTVETLLMGFLPAIAIIATIYYRTDEISSTNIFECIILAIKFALFHVLFQISGYYRYIFA